MDLAADTEQPDICTEGYAAVKMAHVHLRELGNRGVAKCIGIDLVADLARETQKGRLSLVARGAAAILVVIWAARRFCENLHDCYFLSKSSVVAREHHGVSYATQAWW